LLLSKKNKRLISLLFIFKKERYIRSFFLFKIIYLIEKIKIKLPYVFCYQIFIYELIFIDI